MDTSSWVALSLYYWLLPYRCMAAIDTEMRNVRRLTQMTSLRLRTPLLSLHVNTLPLIRHTEKRGAKDYLKIVPTGE